MKKSEKPFFVDNLAEELKSATSVVLVDYTGLTVKLQQEMKKTLKQIGARMFVAKNTLFRLAADKAKLPKDTTSDTALTGPTAFILTEADPIAPLQVIYKFALEHELPQFKVGIVEGNFQDKEALSMLAKLPSKDVLLAQAVGTIAGPMYGLVGVLQGNLQKLLYLIQKARESEHSEYSENQKV